MNKQSLIVFNIPVLFRILNEISSSLNFDIFEFNSFDDLNDINKKKFGNYLIISHTKIPDNLNMNFVYLNKNPLKINDIIEKININLLKNKFLDQSKVNINKFQLDLNSRIIYLENKKLKLTEREIDIILYLDQSKKSKTIENLQKEVWGHGVDLETHTVETHIYRLRKKIKDTFGNTKFIVSTDNGYKLK